MVRLIDRKSEGDILHFTQLLERMKSFGFVPHQPEPESIQQVHLPNTLLMECCSLDHLKDVPFESRGPTLSSQQFYALLTNDGEHHHFTDNQVQRLAHLFSNSKGEISFSLIQKAVIQYQNMVSK